MNVNLVGNLKNPHNEALAEATIQFIASKSSAQTLKSISASVITDENGHYDIIVPYGTFDIKVKQKNRNAFQTIATDVRINDSTTASTLNGVILENASPEEATPTVVLQIESLKSEIATMKSDTQSLRDEVVGIEINLQNSVDTIDQYDTRLTDLENSVGSLAGMQDVTLTSAANGEVLSFNGTEWVNSTVDSLLPEFTVSDITGLQTALDSKTATGHGHAIADVTGLQTAIDGKAPVGHTHVLGDITNVQDSATDGQILQYDEGSATWIPTTYNPEKSMSELTNVADTGIGEGQVLKWDGTNYVPYTIPIPSGGTNGNGVEYFDDLIDVSVGGALAGEFVYFNGATFSTVAVSIPNDLSDLADIDVDTPSDGHILSYNTVTSRFENVAAPTPGATQLNGLSDVSTTIVTNNQVLQFDTDVGRWVNKTLPNYATNINTIQGTNINTPAEGQILKRTGVQWVNDFVNISEIPNLQSSLDNKTDIGHGHIIADVTGLQTALDGKAPNVHTHTMSQVSGLQAALDGKANNSHAHAIVDVTGLQVALDGKSDDGHGHVIADVANLQTELNSKSNTGHGHVIADVTGLQSALDGKTAIGHTHVVADITDIQPVLNSKADAVHPHTIADVDLLQTALDGKTDTGHVHVIADTTGLQDALDTKAELIHVHEIDDINGLQTQLNSKASDNHSHPMEAVDGLDTALSMKSDMLHTHAISGVDGLQTELDGKSNTGHGHVIADVTGLQAELDTLEADAKNARIEADEGVVIPEFSIKAGGTAFRKPWDTPAPEAYRHDLPVGWVPHTGTLYSYDSMVFTNDYLYFTDGLTVYKMDKQGEFVWQTLVSDTYLSVVIQEVDEVNNIVYMANTQGRDNGGLAFKLDANTGGKIGDGVSSIDHYGLIKDTELVQVQFSYKDTTGNQNGVLEESDHTWSLVKYNYPKTLTGGSLGDPILSKDNNDLGLKFATEIYIEKNPEPYLSDRSAWRQSRIPNMLQLSKDGSLIYAVFYAGTIFSELNGSHDFGDVDHGGWGLYVFDYETLNLVWHTFTSTKSSFKTPDFPRLLIEGAGVHSDKLFTLNTDTSIFISFDQATGFEVFRQTLPNTDYISGHYDAVGDELYLARADGIDIFSVDGTSATLLRTIGSEHSIKSVSWGDDDIFLSVQNPYDSDVHSIKRVSIRGMGVTIGEVSNEIPAGTLNAQNLLIDGQQVYHEGNLPAGGGGGATTMNDLTDVTTTNNQDNQVLTWDALALEWTNEAVDYGNITNTPALSSVATSGDYVDLVNTPDMSTKADTVHTHVIADVTNLQTELDGKAPTSHAHVIADVTGLQTELDGKLSNTASVNDLADVDMTGMTTGQVLEWDGTQFIPSTVDASGATQLSELSDVDNALTPADGQGLIYNATSGKFEAQTISGGGGATTMNDLTDVNAATPAFKDFVVFDGTNWMNTPAVDVLDTSDISGLDTQISDLQADVNGKLSTQTNSVESTLTYANGEPSGYVPFSAIINGVTVNFTTDTQGQATYSLALALEEDMAVDINAAGIPNLTASTANNKLILTTSDNSAITVANDTADTNGDHFAGTDSISGIAEGTKAPNSVVKLPQSDIDGLEADISDLDGRVTTLEGSGVNVINDLTDVDTTGITTDQVLKFNGTNFVPYSIPANTDTAQYDSKSDVTISAGSVTFDLVSPTSFVATMDQDITSVTFSNAPADKFVVFSIAFIQDATGGHTVSWPAEVQGTPAQPNPDPDSVTIMSFATFDGGTTIYQAGA